ncbi:MAG TPA: PadR family transcriptional regulator [Candidatus Dormibacteraeota bacterium]
MPEDPSRFSGGYERGNRWDGGQPRNFIRPCLLLLLRESPSYGYQLLDRLAPFRAKRDHSGLYRALRSLEQEGLLQSDWEIPGGGPDRRRYQVTPEGELWLDAWAASIRETQRVLALYLRRYRRLRAPSGRRGGRRIRT